MFHGRSAGTFYSELVGEAMRRTDASHFSHVLSAVQRTTSLPGGEIRGLPNGRSVDGLKGIQPFALELSEAQKEFEQGRLRSALDRVKQLEVQFNVLFSRWEAVVNALLDDIRQSKNIKNLDKLKDLKAAQVRMLQLVIPARKTFQDLMSALDHDAVVIARESSGASSVKASVDHMKRPETAHFGANPVDSREDENLLSPGPECSDHVKPDESALGGFASNYECGTKLEHRDDPQAALAVEPAFEQNRFYFLAGAKPPRVIRVRNLQPNGIVVFDTLGSCEALIEKDDLIELLNAGIWLLVEHANRELPRATRVEFEPEDPSPES